jgi:hypothetical protein
MFGTRHACYWLWNAARLLVDTIATGKGRVSQSQKSVREHYRTQYEYAPSTEFQQLQTFRYLLVL